MTGQRAMTEAEATYDLADLRWLRQTSKAKGRA
jgi:hypothetical protein